MDEKLATGALDIAALRGATGLSCWCAPKGAPLSAAAEPDRRHAQYLAYLVEREDENGDRRLDRPGHGARVG